MKEQGRVIVQNDKAPAPVGPYSQAIKCGDYVFVSGQLGLDTASGKLVSEDAAGQTAKILEHLHEILMMADSAVGRVVKTTIFLTDLGDFEAVNKVYAEVFDFEPPARSCVQVAALPKGAKVEIEVIAQCRPSQPQTSGGLGGLV